MAGGRGSPPQSRARSRGGACALPARLARSTSRLFTTHLGVKLGFQLEFLSACCNTCKNAEYPRGFSPDPLPCSACGQRLCKHRFLSLLTKWSVAEPGKCPVPVAPGRSVMLELSNIAGCRTAPCEAPEAYSTHGYTAHMQMCTFTHRTLTRH